MKQLVLKVHPQDNVLVALSDLVAGQTVTYQGLEYVLVDDIPAKHKFYTTDMLVGAEVYMYGTLVGKVQSFIVQVVRWRL